MVTDLSGSVINRLKASEREMSTCICWSFCIFAAFVPLIKSLPRVRMMELFASGILSGVTKRKFFEVRSEDAQCTEEQFCMV